MDVGLARGFLDRVRLEGTARQHLEIAAIVGGIVAVAALLGIALRSAGLLAAVSPANAILLGLMVRYPHLATPVGWAAAVAGYLVADLLTGNSLLNTLLLTVTSLAGVVAGYVLLQRESHETRQMIGPTAVLRLALVLLAAAAVAALFGTAGNLLVTSTASFMGFATWLVGELVSYLAIVPVMLTLPDGLIRQYDLKHRPDLRQIDFVALAPAAVLIVACLAGLVVGGLATLAFPLVAMLWCGLTYSVFTTALLTLFVSIWTLGAIAFDAIPGISEIDEAHALISVRLAVTLMGLAPLTIASAMAAHRALSERFGLLASHDVLSGLLTRHAFAERSEQLLAQAAQANAPVAVLMLDIDHFKKINVTYGHWAGDRAIETFAAVLRNTLSDEVLIGRLGGEEFAALLAGASPSDAAAAAEQIRQVFTATPIDLGDGRKVEATLSIGLGCAAQAPASIEPLLEVADEALSLAKGGGRNRTVRRDIAMPRGTQARMA